jgi:hypothetical protein
VRARAIGPIIDLDLKDAKIHADLNDLPAVVGLHQPRLHRAGTCIPALQSIVNVLIHEPPA